MARIQSQSPGFHREGLNLIVELYQNNSTLIYPKMVVQSNNMDNVVRVATEGDFSPAAMTNEATPISYQDFETPYVRDYSYFKRALGWAVSTEATETAKYDLFKKRAPKMVRAMDKAKEADIANFINLATSSSLVTPDGLSLANAAHLLAAGTFSNIVTGNPALSVAALAAARAQLLRQPSHAGDPSMFVGPYILIVPPELEDLARRLVGSAKQPTTNDNDNNFIGSTVDSVVVNPYITSTTAWALVVADKEFNPLQMVTKRNLTMKEQFDIDHDVNKFTATAIWTKVAKDGRGIVYSAGQ